MISASVQRLKYVLGDFASSTIAWFMYTCIRYVINEDLMHLQGYKSLDDFLLSPNVILGMALFPIVMMGVYYLSGYYNEVFRKSRLQELFTTLASTVINSLMIFFSALINDMATDRAYNYEMILILFGLLFVFVYCVRAIITSHGSRMIKNRKWQFNTLVIGDGKDAVALGRNFNKMRESIGYNVVGYVHIAGEESATEGSYELSSLKSVCAELGVQELIVAPTGSDTKVVLDTINQLFTLNLPIKITPTLSDIILSRVKLQQLVGDPLVDISSSSMSESSKNIKRLFDVLISGVSIVLLLPVYVLLAVLIKLDTKGGVVYKQTRIGLHKKPFKIYKFRSMIENAENLNEPQLSSDDDPRITKVGKWMRKYRLDETLQFINVLKGDMSLVGPRPEREFYINQITKQVPYYSLLHQVRPGITSLGMVKYGYACSVDEMIERTKYDLLYLENMSLINDIKIMIYTVKIVINGSGV